MHSSYMHGCLHLFHITTEMVLPASGVQRRALVIQMLYVTGQSIPGMHRRCATMWLSPPRTVMLVFMH